MGISHDNLKSLGGEIQTKWGLNKCGLRLCCVATHPASFKEWLIQSLSIHVGVYGHFLSCIISKTCREERHRSGEERKTRPWSMMEHDEVSHQVEKSPPPKPKLRRELVRALGSCMFGMFLLFLLFCFCPLGGAVVSVFAGDRRTGSALPSAGSLRRWHLMTSCRDKNWIYHVLLHCLWRVFVPPCDLIFCFGFWILN